MIAENAVPRVYPLNVPSECVLYYDMQDMGGRIIDHSGMGIHGTVSGASVVTAPTGTARMFNGVSDYITADGSAAVSVGISQDFTLEAWVRPDADCTEYARIFGKYDTNSPGYGYRGYALLLSNAGRFTFVIQPDSPTSKLVGTPAGTDYRGRWMHLVGTADRDTAMKLYVNGAMVAQSFTSTLFDVDITGNLAIGRGYNDPRMFKGLIGETRMYRTALSAADVQTLFQNSAWRYGVPG